MVADSDSGVGVTQVLDMMLQNLQLAPVRSDCDDRVGDEDEDEELRVLEESCCRSGVDDANSLVSVESNRAGEPEGVLFGSTEHLFDYADLARQPALADDGCEVLGGELAGEPALYAGGLDFQAVDVEQLMQALLFQEGVFDTHEPALGPQGFASGAVTPAARFASSGAVTPAARFASSGAVTPAARFASSGAVTPAARWVTPSGAMTPARWAALSSTGQALRDLRRSTAFSELSESAQATLLGGTLCSYDEPRSPTGRARYSADDAYESSGYAESCDGSVAYTRPIGPALAQLLQVSLDGALSANPQAESSGRGLGGATLPSYAFGAGPPDSMLEETARSVQSSSSPHPGPAFACPVLARSLASSSQARPRPCSRGVSARGFSRSSEYHSARSFTGHIVEETGMPQAAASLTLGSSVRSSFGGPAGPEPAFRDFAGRAGADEGDGVAHSGAAGPMVEDADFEDLEEEGLTSTAGAESLGITPRSARSPPGRGTDPRFLLQGQLLQGRAAGVAGTGGRETPQPADVMDETSSAWDFGGTGQSAPSTHSGTLQQSARTVFGDTLALDASGGSDGGAGIAGLLQQLALDGFSIDEDLSRSVQRMQQLGSVLQGHRLTDDEIRALPKVRFEAEEQRSCPICLEGYQQGEVLTALRCSHFFHVDCLARWFQNSTQCPLCRSHAE